MHNEVNMSCDDIKKRVQSFLDDLLAEDEYKAFCDHISACDKCRVYVRSIGSLSNQLWKLGNVKVPTDLSSTILYKLTHPEQEAQPAKYVLSKKQITAGLILISLVIALFFGMKYFKTRQHSQGDNTPIIRTEVIHGLESPGENEARLLFKQLESIASKLGLSEKEKAPGPDSEKDNLVGKEAPISKEPSVEDGVMASKVAPLHWHFLCSVKSEDAELKKEMQKTEARIQQELKRKELLSGEIERLQKEVQQIEDEQRYSKNIQKTASEQELQKKSDLQNKLEEMKREEEDVRSLEEEKRRLELQLRNTVEEKQHKEIERKTKLLNTLSALTIRMDYQENDILVFAATGEKVERVLEQILFISDTSSFRDFTTNVSTLPDKEYKISIYLEHDKAGALHWHVDPIMPSKKSDLLDIIKEYGSSFNYESDELVVFSIPSTEIQKLRNRIQAARVSFSEYGVTESREHILTSGPITISIYFTK